MNDLELKQIWKAYDQRIDEAKLLNHQSWAVNLKTFEFLQKQKSISKLNSLALYKSWFVVAGIVWILFLGLLVYGNQLTNLYFTFSLVMIIAFTLIAVGVYIQHIIMIKRINYTDNIAETQTRLLKLKASTMNIGRILFLQAPFYSTFFWSSSLMNSNALAFWLINVPITLLLAFISFWIYKNIHYKNADKKWFRAIFNGKEWNSVINAIDDLNEIDTFKQEVTLV